MFPKSNFKLSLSLTGGAFRKRNSFLMSFDFKFYSAAPGYLILKKMQNKTNDKNIISICDAVITGDNVAVDYTLNDNWLFISLSLSELKQFALNRSLNDYIFNHMHGRHIQHEGSFPIDTFMAENLEAVIKVYLEAYPLESVTAKLVKLFTILNPSYLTTLTA